MDNAASHFSKGGEPLCGVGTLFRRGLLTEAHIKSLNKLVLRFTSGLTAVVIRTGDLRH